MQNNKIKEIDDYIDGKEREIVVALQEIIRIKSVVEAPEEGMPFGQGIGDALSKTLEISKRLGLITKNMDGYVGVVEYGGEEKEEYVAVLGHLDVVAEGEGWEFPPYAAKVVDGKIYGRGAMDNKGPLIASIFALKAISEMGIDLKRRVRIILGTDEESYFRDVQHYNLMEKPPRFGFTPDANFPAICAEKGIINMDISADYSVTSTTLEYLVSGQSINSVPSFAEAKIGEKIFSAKGVSAHGSTPELGENAAMKLVHQVMDDGNLEDEILEKMVFLRNILGYETDGSSIGIKTENPIEGDLTLNLGILEIKDGKIKASLDIRYPSNTNEMELVRKISKISENFGYKVGNVVNEDPLFFPKEDPLVKTLVEVFKEYTGIQMEPLCIGGGTYAKAMKNIIAFGPVMPGQIETEHSPEEHIEIRHLMNITKIFARAIVRLGNL